jgi:putative ABC transport system permease protein
MMAIGTGRGSVWKLFFLEGLLTGLIGAIVGVGAGALVATMINHGQVMLPPPPGYTTGYRLQILLDPRVLGVAFAVSVITATVSSILPAFRASRLRIVDALGHI